jgi:hypothetical protein
MVGEHLSGSCRARLREEADSFASSSMMSLLWPGAFESERFHCDIWEPQDSQLRLLLEHPRRSSMASTFQTSSSKSHRYASVDRYTLFA